MSFDNNHFDDAADYNYFCNGPTNHGTFAGTCKNCGIVWEFKNYEVIPVPYPHGTSRQCKRAWIISSALSATHFICLDLKTRFSALRSFLPRFP